MKKAKLKKKNINNNRRNLLYLYINTKRFSVV